MTDKRSGRERERVSIESHGREGTASGYAPTYSDAHARREPSAHLRLRRIVSSAPGTKPHFPTRSLESPVRSPPVLGAASPSHSTGEAPAFRTGEGPGTGEAPALLTGEVWASPRGLSTRIREASAGDPACCADPGPAETGPGAADGEGAAGSEVRTLRSGERCGGASRSEGPSLGGGTGDGASECGVSAPARGLRNALAGLYHLRGGAKGGSVTASRMTRRACVTSALTCADMHQCPLMLASMEGRGLHWGRVNSHPRSGACRCRRRKRSERPLT